MAAPQFKAVLIATPQMRSESGLTFRSKQSAVWPADPRGRRGGREPAGKTCYLPRFRAAFFREEVADYPVGLLTVPTRRASILLWGFCEHGQVR
jgi:hypothetical protein